MKKVKALLIGIQTIILVGLLLTIMGHVPYIKDENPEEAVLKILNQYDINPDRSCTRFEALEYGNAIPSGPMIKYRIYEKDKAVAEVKVQSFIGFGWLEDTFQRL